jgi:acetyl-CoA carboxylase alpha subunit
MALLAGTLAVSNSITLAADANTTTAEPKATAKAAALAKSKDRVARLAQKMKLTAEQMEKLKPIYLGETEKLRQETQQSLAARTKIREDFRTEVKESKILTDDQYVQWLAMQTKATKPASKAK